MFYLIRILKIFLFEKKRLKIYTRPSTGEIHLGEIMICIQILNYNTVYWLHIRRANRDGVPI